MNKRKSPIVQIAVFLVSLLLILGALALVSARYRPRGVAALRARAQEVEKQIQKITAGTELLRQDAEARKEQSERVISRLLGEFNGQSQGNAEHARRLVGGVVDPGLDARIAENERRLQDLLAQRREIRQQTQERQTAMAAEMRDLLGELDKGNSGRQDDRAVMNRVSELAREMGVLNETDDDATGTLQDTARTNVGVRVLEETTMRDVLTLPAAAEAWEDIQLAAKDDGTVDWVGPQEGGHVGKGDPVAKIDTNSLVHQLESAQAAADLARVNRDRIANLRKADVASQDELDRMESQCRQAEAARAIARQAYDDATLLSPIGGVVDEILPDVGEFVNRGETVARIVDVSRIKLIANVPEKDISFFNTGQSARVGYPELVSGFTSGTITRIGMVADPMSKTFRVEVTVDNPRGVFRPGMIAKVELVRRTRERAIVIPLFAHLQTPEGPLVYVEKDGRAEARRVETGIRRGMEVEVTKGLRAGDRLIVSGQRALSDGAPVRVVEGKE
jgi:membrane fusion protein (multidrug efflux system)